jgi:pimeloyl-ACP methyl ester carboxylesterase
MDRVDAANHIRREVARIRQELPLERIFLIGHSHGGSAAAYFLRDAPQLAKQVAGVAFLSTPFLAMRPRTDIAEIVHAFMFMSALLMMTTVAYVIGQSAVTLSHVLDMPLLGSDSFFRPYSFEVFAIIIRIGAISYAVLVLLIYSVWGQSTDVLVRLLRKRLSVAVKRKQTADLPDGNFLFLRATGDEAAIALSAAQAINWVVNKLASHISMSVSGIVVLRDLSLTHWIGRTAIVVFGYCCFLMLCIWFLNFYFINDGAITGTLSLSLGVSSMDAIILTALYYLTPLGVFVLFATYIYTGAIVALLLFGLLALRAFGWLSLFEAIFLNVSVEPLPFGPAVLEHISWRNSDGLSSEALSHSWSYSHPQALKRLEDWCRAAL